MKTFLVDIKTNLARYLDDPLWLAPHRYFWQVEFAEHIDARERCQHLASFRHSLPNWIIGVIGWLIKMRTCFPTLIVCKRRINISFLIDIVIQHVERLNNNSTIIHWGFQLICFGQRSLQLPRKRLSIWHGATPLQLHCECL